MISDEAVEVAMGALDEVWITDASRAQLREMMQAVLEAAAPYMLAGAWGDSLQYAYEEGYFTRPQLEALQATNPYRSQA